MVLANSGIEVSESELINKIKPDYGNKFFNIWNTSIAKLASEYGIKTSLYALWPLLKPDIFLEAATEFKDNPDHFDANKYEHPNDKDVLPEPLPLAYKEMFKAVDKGCQVAYGSLTDRRIDDFLKKGLLIQTSVKVHKLYPDAPRGFHSILIYGRKGSIVEYHDPFVGPSLKVDIQDLIKVASDNGAFMVYSVT
jgi:hypothetical protein